LSKPLQLINRNSEQQKEAGNLLLGLIDAVNHNHSQRTLKAPVLNYQDLISPGSIDNFPVIKDSYSLINTVNKDLNKDDRDNPLYKNDMDIPITDLRFDVVVEKNLIQSSSKSDSKEENLKRSSECTENVQSVVDENLLKNTTNIPDANKQNSGGMSEPVEILLEVMDNEEVCTIKNQKKRLKKHQCNDCGLLFYKKSRLESHRNSFHKGLKLFECHECGKSFSRKDYLKIHQNKHEGNTPHKCKLCKNSYLYRNQLIQHVNSAHKGIKSYQCEECGKSYYYRNDLKRHHDKIHKGLSPHTCDLCDKSFLRKDHLENHKNAVHLKIKSHNCEVCGKSYTRREHLNRHQKIHHYFNCNECGKSFARENVLAIHLVTHKGRPMTPPPLDEAIQ